MRLRAGRAGAGKGAARMVAQAIAPARAAGATGTILVRVHSAYGTRTVVNAYRRAGSGRQKATSFDPVGLVDQTISQSERLEHLHGAAGDSIGLAHLEQTVLAVDDRRP